MPSLTRCGSPLWLALWAALAISLPGCGGCGNESPNDLEKKLAEEREKKEKKKADFELKSLRTQPSSPGSAVTYFKPGHWTSTSVEAIANNSDFNGRIVTDPFTLDGMPYRLGAWRPAVLPKGQPKDLELVLYVPPGRANTRITTRLTPADIQRELVRRDDPATRMAPHQFHLVVLCPEGERYKFLSTRKMLSIYPPSGDFGDSPDPNYRVSIPALDQQVPLPSHWLTWTSIAYLIWDGVDPALLSLDQQQALIDWLHFGGQLIVSGPESLELLRGSFLSDYLPATADGEMQIAADNLSDFNRDWTQWGKPLAPARAWQAVRLKPAGPSSAGQANTVRVLAATDDDQPLVVDRRIGRGRIVVTAFKLSQRELNLDVWRSFDGFFHACLLGLPARRLKANDDIIEFALDDAVLLQVDNNFRSPAEVNSQVRILSRDIDRTNLAELAAMTGMTSLEQVDGGVASWSNFGGAAHDARQTLREAAGIYIPEARFIIRLLGLYLLILVPGNYLLFWLIGRVEWCWLAAPLITLVFALVVVREAQLDIGFARAQTDLAVVELQPGHPRAHVTRYTALYTSLTTAYDVSFEDGGALAQPFPLFTLEEFARQPSQDPATVYYRRKANGVSLDGFEVRSNSLGMLHSEHSLNVGGGLETTTVNGKLTIKNGSSLSLRDAVVINPQGRVAWLGDLPTGGRQTAEFQFDNLKALSAAHPQFVIPEPRTLPSRNFDATTNPSPPANDSNLSGNFDPSDPDASASGNPTSPAATEPANGNAEAAFWARFAQAGRGVHRDPALAGNLRLLAWSDQPLAGMQIEPAASQNRTLALVVANLQYEPLESPVPDVVDAALKTALATATARAPTAPASPANEPDSSGDVAPTSPP